MGERDIRKFRSTPFSTAFTGRALHAFVVVFVPAVQVDAGDAV